MSGDYRAYYNNDGMDPDWKPIVDPRDARIAELEKALSYYANPKSWERICIEKSSFEQYQPSIYRVDAHVDSGAIARAALKL